MLRDARDVAPVSAWRPGLGCCLSLPCVLGRGGVVGDVPAALDADEALALERSAARLREAVAGFGTGGDGVGLGLGGRERAHEAGGG